jgi:hypothetical protein
VSGVGRGGQRRWRERGRGNWERREGGEELEREDGSRRGERGGMEEIGLPVVAGRQFYIFQGPERGDGAREMFIAKNPRDSQALEPTSANRRTVRPRGATAASYGIVRFQPEGGGLYCLAWGTQHAAQSRAWDALVEVRILPRSGFVVRLRLCSLSGCVGAGGRGLAVASIIGEREWEARRGETVAVVLAGGMGWAQEVCIVGRSLGTR